MLLLRRIQLTCLDRDSVTVAWEIESSPAEPADFTLTVLRAECEGGPYDAVSDALPGDGVPEFEDTTPNLLAKWRDFHYRLRVTRLSDSATREYGSVPYDVVLRDDVDPGGIPLEAAPDLVAIEASRRFDLILQEYTGRRVVVLPVKTFGTRCSNCWDALKRRKAISNCTTCYATGVTGGFYDQRITRTMKVPHEISVALTPLFEMQPGDVLFWFSNRPRLKPRDVMVDGEGWRWRIEQLKRSEKLWALTRQTAQLRRITRDQVEYNFPVSWTGTTLSASPTRAYLNATDIQSYYANVNARAAREEEDLG